MGSILDENEVRVWTEARPGFGPKRGAKVLSLWVSGLPYMERAQPIFLKLKIYMLLRPWRHIRDAQSKKH